MVPIAGVDSVLIEIASQAPAPPQLVTRLLAAFAVAKEQRRHHLNLAVVIVADVADQRRAPGDCRRVPQFRQSSGCTIIPTCTKGTCLPATAMSDSSSSLGVGFEHDARLMARSPDSMRPHAQNLGQSRRRTCSHLARRPRSVARAMAICCAVMAADGRSILPSLQFDAGPHVSSRSRTNSGFRLPMPIAVPGERRTRHQPAVLDLAALPDLGNAPQKTHVSRS